jgi:glycosyltransferase involved in cell wall biosynthesis
VPNGLDLCATLGLTPSVTEFARRHRLLDRQVVLLHPTRVLARKNIELGLAVTAALRGMGQDAVYVVTGAPDPHRKSSAAYATSLHERIVELGLEEAVLFVSNSFPVRHLDVASLYRIADALFFPSRTEGFGLPLLEAMLHRLPVICSDIPPHREVAGNAARYFSLDVPPQDIAGMILRVLGKDSRRSARRRVQGRFGWQYIYKEYLEPLIKER